MVKHHRVKSWSHFFQDIKSGKKLHDLRHDDRGYEVGDFLILEEYDPFLGVYAGEEITVEITYITSRKTPCAFSLAVLQEDYVILSIVRVELD